MADDRLKVPADSAATRTGSPTVPPDQARSSSYSKARPMPLPWSGSLTVSVPDCARVCALASAVSTKADGAVAASDGASLAASMRTVPCSMFEARPAGPPALPPACALSPSDSTTV